ncbi:AAA family ATPase [uncultured Thiodictyon sp.]|jgi:energy-coupling factor transporter ATP-binding protein EcfA2|uniref:AAA family ATPase n=1 Tax=uncultured Thiodictyon sp. TaxID=1846217 RepID=UPI0025D476BE|nr:AAA family ATPase [uncultured Thiodictyon sp.]
MHIRQIHIKNIKSIRELTWDFPQDRAKGWHVVLGDNGSGKSTVLKAIAAALLGPRESYGLRQAWDTWLSYGSESGEIRLVLEWNDEIDQFASFRGMPPPTKPHPFILELKRSADNAKSVAMVWPTDGTGAAANLWGDEIGGCFGFSASYGAFRRFSGGSSTAESTFSETLRRLTRHLSLFDDGYTLVDSLSWWRICKLEIPLKEHFRLLLDRFIGLVNDAGLLPSGVRLKDVTPDRIEFRDASGVPLPINELSDGYRSILSIVFDLVFQLALAFGWDWVFDPEHDSRVIAPGVVLIDEIDAHLHPTWQKRIGYWLTEHFPNIQFIVSTHSPLICHAAEHGSILLLPRSGTDDQPRLLEGTELKRVVYGNVLDAYGTDAFGEEAATTRSPTSQAMRGRLALLNNKELVKGLDESERNEQEALRAAMPTAAASVD